jgi:hypothetical protein
VEGEEVIIAPLGEIRKGVNKNKDIKANVNKSENILLTHGKENNRMCP